MPGRRSLHGAVVAQNYQVILRYDGRGFYGWQRLKEHPSIQQALESAIIQGLGETAVVQGAGRTDRGAHADGQSAGFRLEKSWDEEDLIAALNAALHAKIQVIGARKVPDDFHVRESATAKEYEYRIYNADELPEELDGFVWHVPAKLDLEAMTKATASLLGVHDFASFATKTRFKKKSCERDMFMAELQSHEDFIVLRFGAESFLNHMVRNLARAIVRVGDGRYSLERFQEILVAANRAESPGTAPASGLYLMNVFYDE